MNPLHCTIILACLTLPAAAMAADCAARIESYDAMQYSTRSIAIPASCTSFRVTLAHTGKLPKTAMGHNIVITSAADAAAVGHDAIAAGVGNGYLEPGDTRVIAHSALIGGGETSQFDVPVAKLKPGANYVFFCSFPGHNASMKGTLQVTQ